MFHSVTARMIRPNTGKISKAISNQAATRFQPDGGNVNRMRQVL